MRNLFSLIACFAIAAVMLQYRVAYSDLSRGNPPLKITEWDAFGYYAYLPAMFIYHDCTQLKWVPEIDRKYAVTGGDGVQAERAGNGSYVFKYLGGVAIMEMPFFFIGDIIAKTGGYPADGFSRPYQYAVSFGCILYCILAIFLLRNILLRYFSDATTAITMPAVCLGSNFIEYAAIENGQSHGFIFPLYALVLYTTIKWHERPRAKWAALTGFIIGLATISRPTEAIMLFIPLLWNTHTKGAATAKWQLVRQYRKHAVWVILFGLAGVLPQLIYWKVVTGSMVYDVGSAWNFLNPHFRVLFGWEKGWFIYTPITVFFVVGLFFVKQFNFRKSVLWFCLLNIYIIIAWREWRYGGSYSTRALVQSYPVFSLAFAAFTERILRTKWRWLVYAGCLYLVPVNLFQITQYRKTIIHYDDMNRRYYSRVYLNFHPTPTDMSLLDSNELLNNEHDYNKMSIARFGFRKDTARFAGGGYFTVFHRQFDSSALGMKWLKIECSVRAPGCLWQTYLHADLKTRSSVKHTRVRLLSPISSNDSTNHYAFYMSVPGGLPGATLDIYLTSPFDFKGTLPEVNITGLIK